MKHLIPLGALFLSAVACGSDEGEPGTPGAGGSASSMAGAPSAGGGGAGGSPSAGGAGMSPSAGSGVGGAAGGQAPTGGAGASSLGGGGNSSGGAAGGMSPGGSGNGGGASGGGNGSGGTGPSASFKCDNLSLAPSKTGVAKPSGAAGGLKVLDWAGFKGAASFTFDDNTPSQMPNYPALKATGGHVTWFVVSNWLNGSADVAKFKATIADGHEVANHTNTHQSSGSANDLQQAQSFIKTNFGVDAHSMAAPNCADAWASVAPNVLFQNRGPCGGGVATVSPRDNTSPFRLPAYLPATNEAASKMSAAIQPGKWRIFVLHGFDSQNGTYQPVPIANVTGAMSQAVTDGYWVEGMTNVGAYWQGQKLIPDSATTSAKWTLPDKFPPNMCVRITTTGGTVTQKGETIPWNDHGYYQISLDAGEVTVN